MAKLGNVLGNLRGNILDGGAGFATATQGPGGGLFREVTDGSRYPYHVPTIHTVNMRNWGSADTWSSTYGGSNWWAYQNNNQVVMEQSFWMSLASNRQNATSQNNISSQAFKRIDWASSNSVGSNGFELTNSGWSYGPVTFRTMFLRNHSSISRTTTVWGQISTYWNNGHDGSACIVGTPNSSTYSGATSMTWTQANSSSGSNDAQRTYTASVTIPARTTVAVVQIGSAYDFGYNSHNGNLYHWRLVNKFYNLHGTWDGGANWIQPDPRLTWAAWTYTGSGDHTASGITSHTIWNRAAQLYGDR